VAADWLSWLFHLDYQVEELPPGLIAAATDRQPPRQLTAALQPGEQFADNPASRALANLWRRTTRLTSTRWQERCAADVIDYLRRLRQEVSNRSRRRAPEVELFLALDMIELAERVDVPADLAASPEYRALREAANDVVFWTNEVASQATDVARGDGTAIRHATETIHRRIEDFLAAKRPLPAACNRLLLSPASRDGLRRLVAGCEAWMRGNRDWSLQNERLSGSKAAEPPARRTGSKPYRSATASSDHDHRTVTATCS